VSNRSLQLALLLGFGVCAQLAAAPPPASATADERLLDVGRELPGFGGLFVDDRGTLNVYLLDLRREQKVALEALGPSRLLQADYRFEDLVGWRRALRPLLGEAAVALLDVDEARNRVVLGVVPGTSRAERDRLAALLASRGVPPAAVVLEESPLAVVLPGTVAEAQASSNLQRKLRPVPGGVQVVFPIEAATYGVCTIGFNAYRGKQLGFVINQHCTAVLGEVDGVAYSQSYPGEGIIGSEVLDPPFAVEGDCPGGRRCRYSDAAFARYAKKSYGSFARLARPTTPDPDAGSLVLSPVTARFAVIGKAPDPLLGDTVHKVGRTTGWTFGQVIGTCVDTRVSGSDITMLCQTVVAGGADHGDSGSPVFVRVGSTQARIAGILWGGFPDPELGARFLFSPLSGVERELGALRVN
jgi:hypothetical protein